MLSNINQQREFESANRTSSKTPQAMFLNNLGAMRKAALERKAKRWGFDFEAETPITKTTVVDQPVEFSGKDQTGVNTFSRNDKYADKFKEVSRRLKFDNESETHLLPLKDLNEVEPQKVKSIVNGQITISYETSPVVKED